MIALGRIAIFILSLVFLLWAALIVAKSLSKNKADAFWTVIVCCYLQISLISLFLSTIHGLTPFTFLGSQVIVLILLNYFLGNINKKTWASQKISLRNYSNIEKGILLLVVILLFNSFASRILTPIYWGDVLYYHASRPLYWIQNMSIGPYPTINDRQIVFAFGSDLIFMWPALFTRSEFISRLIYWLGLPTMVIGFYFVMRQLGSSRKWALLGSVTVLSIPIVYLFAGTLEPLVWVCFFGLGTGYWMLRFTQSLENSLFSVFQLGIFSVLTAHMKNFGMVLIIVSGVAVLYWVVYGIESERLKEGIRVLSIYVFAVVAGLVLSGLALLLIQNMILYGSPAGSDFKLHQNMAEHSPYQVYVHTVRLVSVLAEVPMPVFGEGIERFGNQVIHWLKADRLLPKEAEWGWVGHYQYQAKHFSDGKSFGIIGLVLGGGFLGMAITFQSLVSESGIQETIKNVMGAPVFAYALTAFSLLLAPVYLLRWISSGTRSFLTPGVVCVLPLALLSIERVRKPQLFRYVRYISLSVLVLFLSAFALLVFRRTKHNMSTANLNWESISFSQKYSYISSHQFIPENATVILLGHANTKDYPFFGRGYSRRVIQWPYTLNDATLEFLRSEYPGAFVYVDGQRCNNIEKSRSRFDPGHPNFQYVWGECRPTEILSLSSKAREIQWGHEEHLFQLSEEDGGK